MSDRGLWVGVALGGPLLLAGVVDVLGDADRTRPSELLWWVLGAAVVLDLTIVPLGLAAGRVVHRPAWRWALSTSATLLVVGWPFIRRYGERPDNPSHLPRDYATGVAAAIALVWLAALAWWARSRRR